MSLPSYSAQRTFAKLGLAAAIASFCLPLAAQQSQEQQGSSWGLGFGVMSSQKAYTDIDRDTKVIPFVSYQNEYIEVLGPNLKYKLPSLNLSDRNRFNFNIVGEYDFSDNDPDETPILNGMDERKGGFWAGVAAEWENEVVNLSLELLTEAAGDSDGAIINLGLEKTWHVGQNYMLTPRVVFSHLDKNYVDYYYGVRADEIRIDRAFYQGEAALNTEVGLRAVYLVDQQQLVMLDLSVTSLANEIKDSPLVDSSTESRVMLAYIYRF